MTFRISRLRVVGAEDAGFSDLVSVLPDGAETCLYCGHRSRDSLAMVLVADESDDNPLALCTAVCSICSTGQSADQLLTDWAERLAEHRRPGDKVQLLRDNQKTERIASAQNVTQQATVASSRCSRCLMLPALKFPRSSSLIDKLVCCCGPCRVVGDALASSKRPRQTTGSSPTYGTAGHALLLSTLTTSAGATPNTSLRAASRRHSLRRRWHVRSCPSGYTPGYSVCSRSNSSRDVRHGSASNHSRSLVVTVTNGSGGRRKPFSFGFGAPVGRTSPSCHAVRSPERNCSSVGAVSGVTSPVTRASARLTSSCWAARICCSRRTGSNVPRSASRRSRTSSRVRASASNR